jgi:copper(I)-binding protein
MRNLASLAALLLLSCNAGREPKVEATNGWTREVAPGQSAAAAYVTISNSGNGADRLVGAESPASATASMHSSSSVDGIARMRRIEGGVDIPAGSAVAFEPGGNHIMLEGLKQPLKEDQSAELILTFERSGRRTIALKVLPATADGHSHGMSM